MPYQKPLLNKSILFFFLIVLSGIHELKAQAPAVEWIRKYSTSSLGDGFCINDAAINSIGETILLGAKSLDIINSKLAYAKFTKYQSVCTTAVLKIDSNGILQQFKTNRVGSIGKSFVFDDSDNIVAVNDKGAIAFDVVLMKIKKELSGDPLFDIYWSRSFGGTGDDIPTKIVRTGDSGYLIAGYTNSTDLATPNHGANDVWLVKTDTAGIMQWSKTYGGSLNDTAYSMVALPDGYVVAGTTTSNNGDITNNNGSQDAWIFKVDLSGNLLWQKTYGGVGRDVLNNVIWDTLTNSLVFSGYSASSTAGFSANHGNHDVWVIKTTMNGELIWSKLLGGSEEDASFGLRIIPGTSNYLITGFTKSNNGDFTRHAFGYDALLLMLDAGGNVIWQKTMGTKYDDYFTIGFSKSNNKVNCYGNADIFQKTNNRLINEALSVQLQSGNTLAGNTYFDVNSNGSKDPGEPDFDQVNIAASKNGLISRTGFVYDGHYEMALDTGSYTIKAIPYSPYYHAVPDSVTISHSNFYNADTIHFGIQPIPGIKDVSISLLPLTPARPGFNVQYKVIVRNVGTEALANIPIQLINDNRLTFQNAFPIPDSIKTDTLHWHIALLHPQDTVAFLILTKAATAPTLAIGNTLQSTAQVLLATDADSSNNVFTLKHIVTGSYDPNDKKNAFGKAVTKEEVNSGGWINYLIRFQNTGTDTAFTVVLRDTLPASVQNNSLQMEDASHPYKMEMKGNALVWRFEAINLPDSNHNKTASNGYVAYKVKAKSASSGDTIKNKAAIYFDFNLPVITNIDLLAIISSPGILCKNGSATFDAGPASAVSYEWQLDDGAGFSPISNNATYSGVNSKTLTLSNIPFNWYGFQYRCKIVSSNNQVVYSQVYTLQFINTWKGTVDSNWHHAANWSCGVLPDEFTDVIIEFSAANQPVITQPGAVCRTAKLLTGAELKVITGADLEIKK